MKSLAIIGAGGNAREIAALARDLGVYEVLGFLSSTEGDFNSPTLGNFDWLDQNPVDCLAMGIGNPSTKLTIARALAERYPHIEWPPLVHPTAYVGATCRLERGALICVNAVATENVSIGEFAQLNFSCSVGHESQIGAGVFIGPGASIGGGVRIGEAASVGIGAAIKQYLTIGIGAVVGGGGMVVRDVKPYTTVLGVPAKVKSNKSL